MSLRVAVLQGLDLNPAAVSPVDGTAPSQLLQGPCVVLSLGLQSSTTSAAGQGSTWTWNEDFEFDLRPAWDGNPGSMPSLEVECCSVEDSASVGRVSIPLSRLPKSEEHERWYALEGFSGGALLLRLLLETDGVQKPEKLRSDEATIPNLMRNELLTGIAASFVVVAAPQGGGVEGLVPEVRTSYPPSSVGGSNAVKVEWFCFPNGVQPVRVVMDGNNPLKSTTHLSHPPFNVEHSTAPPKACFEDVPTLSAIPAPRFFVFVNSPGPGERLYGYTLIFYEPYFVSAPAKREDMLWAPVGLCLLSRLPFEEEFRQCLVQIFLVAYCTGDMDARSLLKGAPILDEAVMMVTQDLPLPLPGLLNIRFSLFERSSLLCNQKVADINSKGSLIDVVRKLAAKVRPITCSLPRSGALPHSPFRFSILFECLSVRDVIRLWSAALLEAKIVLLSTRTALLSTVAETVLALLYPFKWQHAYIPVLPKQLIDFVEAPIPFIIGLHSDFVAHLPSRDVLVDVVFVDLDRGIVENFSSRLRANPVFLTGGQVLLFPAVQRVRLYRRLRAMLSPTLHTSGVLGTPPAIIQTTQLEDETSISPKLTISRSGWQYTQVSFDGITAATPESKEIAFSRGVRMAFLDSIVSVLQGYRECLFFLMSHTMPVFNKPRFMEDWHTRDLHHEHFSEEGSAFLSNLFESQHFETFMEQHDSRELATFHAYYYARLLEGRNKSFECVQHKRRRQFGLVTRRLKRGHFSAADLSLSVSSEEFDSNRNLVHCGPVHKQAHGTDNLAKNKKVPEKYIRGSSARVLVVSSSCRTSDQVEVCPELTRKLSRKVAGTASASTKSVTEPAPNYNDLRIKTGDPYAANVSSSITRVVTSTVSVDSQVFTKFGHCNSEPCSDVGTKESETESENASNQQNGSLSRIFPQAKPIRFDAKTPEDPVSDAHEELLEESAEVSFVFPRICGKRALRRKRWPMDHVARQVGTKVAWLRNTTDELEHFLCGAKSFDREEARYTTSSALSWLSSPNDLRRGVGSIHSTKGKSDAERQTERTLQECLTRIFFNEKLPPEMLGKCKRELSTQLGRDLFILILRQPSHRTPLPHHHSPQRPNLFCNGRTFFGERHSVPGLLAATAAMYEPGASEQRVESARATIDSVLHGGAGQAGWGTCGQGRCLGAGAFESLVELSHALLFACLHTEDFTNARLLLQLSTSFYRAIRRVDCALVSATERCNPSADDDPGTRLYLQSKLRGHALWGSLLFWEHAFAESFHQEIARLQRSYRVCSRIDSRPRAPSTDSSLLASGTATTDTPIDHKYNSQDSVIKHGKSPRLQLPSPSGNASNTSGSLSKFIAEQNPVIAQKSNFRARSRSFDSITSADSSNENSVVHEQVTLGLLTSVLWSMLSVGGTKDKARALVSRVVAVYSLADEHEPSLNVLVSNIYRAAAFTAMEEEGECAEHLANYPIHGHEPTGGPHLEITPKSERAMPGSLPCQSVSSPHEHKAYASTTPTAQRFSLTRRLSNALRRHRSSPAAAENTNCHKQENVGIRGRTEMSMETDDIDDADSSEKRAFTQLQSNAPGHVLEFLNDGLHRCIRARKATDGLKNPEDLCSAVDECGAALCSVILARRDIARMNELIEYSEPWDNVPDLPPENEDFTHFRPVLCMHAGAKNTLHSRAATTQVSTLVTGSMDKHVCVWHIGDGKGSGGCQVSTTAARHVETLISHTEPISCVRVYGNLVLSGAHDGGICVWEISSPEPVSRQAPQWSNSSPMNRKRNLETIGQATTSASSPSRNSAGTSLSEMGVALARRFGALDRDPAAENAGVRFPNCKCHLKEHAGAVTFIEFLNRGIGHRGINNGMDFRDKPPDSFISCGDDGKMLLWLMRRSRKGLLSGASCVRKFVGHTSRPVCGFLERVVCFPGVCVDLSKSFSIAMSAGLTQSLSAPTIMCSPGRVTVLSAFGMF